MRIADKARKRRHGYSHTSRQRNAGGEPHLEDRRVVNGAPSRHEVRINPLKRLGLSGRMMRILIATGRAFLARLVIDTIQYRNLMVSKAVENGSRKAGHGLCQLPRRRRTVLGVTVRCRGDRSQGDGVIG